MVKEKNTKLKLSPKEKVIKHLIEYKEPQSIRYVSGMIVVNYKNTYDTIKDLEPAVVSKERVGNTILIRLNNTPRREIYSVEQKRTEEFLSKNPKFKLIKEDINEINYPFMIVLVFGSFAKGKDAPRSDIDICIISDNEGKIKQLTEKLNLLSLKLEIHTFTTKEFISMIEKKQNNLGNEIVKNNIILYGIENYYNLISKWMKKG